RDSRRDSRGCLVGDLTRPSSRPPGAPGLARRRFHTRLLARSHRDRALLLQAGLVPRRRSNRQLRRAAAHADRPLRPRQPARRRRRGTAEQRSPSGPACAHARLLLDGGDRANDAVQHAGGPRPGLHADRSRERIAGAARRTAPRTSQRAHPNGDHPRSDLRQSSLGRGADRDHLQLAGARISLIIGVVVVASAGVFGTVVGLVAGYAGGLVDEALMRLTEVFLAFPALILAMAIAGALGPSLTNAIIAIAAVTWAVYARL